MFRFTLVVASCALTACTAIVQFDPESQPCDESGACLDHYACVSGLCKYNDGGITLDAGVDAGNCAARETKCGDGIDEDCDGMKDCADSDCAAQACNDGDLCTVGETCSASTGTCQRGTAKDCSSPAPCQTARGTCQPATGMCVYSAQWRPAAAPARASTPARAPPTAAAAASPVAPRRPVSPSTPAPAAPPSPSTPAVVAAARRAWRAPTARAACRASVCPCSSRIAR
jgi:hypothetical protein